VATTNLYTKYQTLSVNTLTPGELIVLLYEELALRMNRAVLHIKNGKMEDAHKSMTKAEDIVLYLVDILDVNYPISDELLPLYEFIYRQLVVANGEKNASILEETVKIVNQMKDVWKEAESINRQKVASGGK